LLRTDLVSIISRGQAALPFVSFLSGICDLHPRLRAINTGNRLLPPFGGILNTPINGSYCVAKHAMESLGVVPLFGDRTSRSEPRHRRHLADLIHTGGCIDRQQIAFGRRRVGESDLCILIVSASPHVM
jgi:hypothetical protein